MTIFSRNIIFCDISVIDGKEVEWDGRSYVQFQVRLEISVSMDIPVLGFYGYIGGYFYMSIDIS